MPFAWITGLGFCGAKIGKFGRALVWKWRLLPPSPRELAAGGKNAGGDREAASAKAGSNSMVGVARKDEKDCAFSSARLPNARSIKQQSLKWRKPPPVTGCFNLYRLPSPNSRTLDWQDVNYTPAKPNSSRRAIRLCSANLTLHSVSTFGPICCKSQLLPSMPCKL